MAIDPTMSSYPHSDIEVNVRMEVAKQNTDIHISNLTKTK